MSNNKVKRTKKKKVGRNSNKYSLSEERPGDASE
jgi:hypothetical protein